MSIGVRHDYHPRPAHALAVGTWQFSRTVRRRLHRVLGRVHLFAGILPGSLAGVVALQPLCDSYFHANTGGR